MSDPTKIEMPVPAGEDHGGHRHGENHVVSLGVYFAVFVALLIGTGLTVLVAEQDLGALNTPVALAIAITKATLVVLFFMHVRYSPRLTKLVVSIAAAWLLLLILGILSDYAFQGWLGGPLKALFSR